MRKAIVAALLAICMVLPFAGPVYAAGMENFVSAEAGIAGSFQDVPEGAWYEGALERCCASGLMEGTGADTFTPQGSLTRAQALVMAVRVRMIYYTGQCQMEESEPWYQSALDYAVTRKMVERDAFDDYDVPATRAEMAHFLAAALPVEEMGQINAVSFLPDVTDETAYRQDIFLLYRTGVLTGSDLFGSFRPKAEITRAEACAILARLVFPELRRDLDLFLPSEVILPQESITAPSGGTVTGQEGTTLRTDLFSFGVLGSYTRPRLNSFRPGAGKRVLAVRLVVENTTASPVSIPASTFAVYWDGEESARPLESSGLLSSQLPDLITLAPHQITAGVLVYEVPKEEKSFTLSCALRYSDGTAAGTYQVICRPEK